MQNIIGILDMKMYLTEALYICNTKHMMEGDGWIRNFHIGSQDLQ